MADRQSSHDPISLERARRDAKRLKRALAAGEAQALARFASVFADRRAAATATHADCLHVLAREAGAESWPKLKLAVETAAYDRRQRVTALERAVLNGNFLLLDRLLWLDPSLATAHLGLQLAFCRMEDARETLRRDPAAATREIAGRLPVHYLCFSKLHQRQPELVPTQCALLADLLAAGADVNAGLVAEPGSDHRLSPLYGALGHAGNLALAEALLRHGADPNDNESLYHATEMPDLAGVRLLFAHGAEVGTTNAFLRMLDVENAEGVALFLANGADPEAPPYMHPDATPMDERTALHHAILRGRSGKIGALLLDAGADPARRLDGRSPYALARVCGNASMAAMLEKRGLADPLAVEDEFLAAVAVADGAGARRLLALQPDMLERLAPRDLARQTDLAMQADNLPVLRLMVELGFDPNYRGESGMPPIHAAAWWGQAETVAFYLRAGADLAIENDFGGDALGTAVHGSANCPAADRGDYPRVVRLLLDAGARIRPERGHLEMGSEEVTLLLEEHGEGAST